MVSLPPMVLGDTDGVGTRYPSGIYLIYATFDEIRIDDSSYCSTYVLNHTNGFIVGYKLHFNEDGTVNETGALFIPLRNETLRFYTFDSFNLRYIGDMFVCVLTQIFYL